MDIYTIIDNHPVLTTLIVLCIFGSIFYTVRALICGSIIKARGYPPPHCNVEGVLIGEDDSED